MAQIINKPGALSTQDLINKAIRGLTRDIETLTEWLLIHPKDYVVIAVDRMYVVQRDGDLAKIAVYPQLPTVFYAADVAYRIAADFKAYKDDGSRIQLIAIKVASFAAEAIKDYRQRVVDLSALVS